jgi:5-methylcytosine-specific restriction protein A
MPFAPKRPCTWPGCPALVDGGRCEKHRRQERKRVDERRGTSSERGYGAHWRKLRALVLREEPLCRECAKIGCVVAATDVDHVIPRARGGTDERNNLQPLCASHHSQKTASQDGRWGKPKQ